MHNLKQRAVKILNAFMFVVFLYGTAPHEYLHDLFAHHHDSVEQVYKKGEFHIGQQHTHCAFLSITFGSFLSAPQFFYLFENICYTSKWVIPVHQPPVFSALHFYSLRGPPGFVSA